MKKILPAFLFFLLLETILSSKITTKMKIVKAIKDIKIKHLRKEENTDQATDVEYDIDNLDPPDDDTDDYDYNDETDIGYDGDYIIPTDVDYNETISSNQAENINATNDDYKVNSTKPVS